MKKRLVVWVFFIILSLGLSFEPSFVPGLALGLMAQPGLGAASIAKGGVSLGEGDLLWALWNDPSGLVGARLGAVGLASSVNHAGFGGGYGRLLAMQLDVSARMRLSPGMQLLIGLENAGRARWRFVDHFRAQSPLPSRMRVGLHWQDPRVRMQVQYHASKKVRIRSRLLVAAARCKVHSVRQL